MGKSIFRVGPKFHTLLVGVQITLFCESATRKCSLAHPKRRLLGCARRVRWLTWAVPRQVQRFCTLCLMSDICGAVPQGADTKLGQEGMHTCLNLRVQNLSGGPEAAPWSQLTRLNTFCSQVNRGETLSFMCSLHLHAMLEAVRRAASSAARAARSAAAADLLV